MLRPEDVTRHDLPLAMRGYDREQVDRFLHRVSEAYLLTWRQALALRERLRTLEEELFHAESELSAGSKEVADLVQRCSTAEDELTQTRKLGSELSAKLERSEYERKEALLDVQVASERASDLEKQLQAYGNGQRRQDAEADADGPADEGAATLLVAAVRAAEDVREASRGRALRTLVKARERAALLHGEAERERLALAEALERRERAEREANQLSEGIREEAERERLALAEALERRELAEREAGEIVERARLEAERVVASVEEERLRMRELLSGALQSLDADSTPSTDGLVADLASRLSDPPA
jgi:DivIVA domain-containing protein